MVEKPRRVDEARAPQTVLAAGGPPKGFDDLRPPMPGAGGAGPTGAQKRGASISTTRPSIKNPGVAAPHPVAAAPHVKTALALGRTDE